MSAADCCLCAQIEGRQENDLISTLLGEADYSRRVLLECRRFALIPSLGPIVPGHSLICPKQHGNSLVRALADDKILAQDYEQFLDRASAALGRAYGAPLHFFEHGSPRNGSHVACSVEHAHLHALPADVSITAVLMRDGNWQPLDGHFLSASEVVGDDEYVCYQAPDGRAFLRVSPVPIESQLMRRIFADALGISANWNWRTHPNLDQVLETCSAIASAKEQTASLRI